LLTSDRVVIALSTLCLSWPQPQTGCLGLHRLPIVGAPTVTVALELGGRTNLAVGIRRLPPIAVPEEVREVWGGIGEPGFEARPQSVDPVPANAFAPAAKEK
jgi:hypothetical protein